MKNNKAILETFERETKDTILETDMTEKQI